MREKQKRTKSGERVNERESINCVHCAGALLLSVAVEVRALTPPAARRDLSQLSDCCIPMQLGHSKACLKLHPHTHTQTRTHSDSNSPCGSPPLQRGGVFCPSLRPWMKRPPWGAEKREDYLSFCPLPSVFLSVCLFIFLSLLVQEFTSKSAHAGTELSFGLLLQRDTTWGVFAGGNRGRRAMSHFCDGCHCGTALAISLSSSSFIIHTVIYSNKWRGACSSLARPRWHRRRSLSQSVPSVCCIKRKLFTIAEFSWLGFSVSHSPESI